MPPPLGARPPPISCRRCGQRGFGSRPAGASTPPGGGYLRTSGEWAVCCLGRSRWRLGLCSYGGVLSSVPRGIPAGAGFSLETGLVVAARHGADRPSPRDGNTPPSAQRNEFRHVRSLINGNGDGLQLNSTEIPSIGPEEKFAREIHQNRGTCDLHAVFCKEVFRMSMGADEGCHGVRVVVVGAERDPGRSRGLARNRHTPGAADPAPRAAARSVARASAEAIRQARSRSESSMDSMCSLANCCTSSMSAPSITVLSPLCCSK